MILLLLSSVPPLVKLKTFSTSWITSASSSCELSYNFKADRIKKIYCFLDI